MYNVLVEVSLAYRLMRYLVKILFSWITPVQINGMENIPISGGYIGTANHLGRLDPFLVYYILDRKDIIMLVAEKYRKYALARWLAYLVDAIWVDRFNADMVAMRETLNRLRKGWVLGIAPEGTRSRTGTLGEGRSGASYLAAKTGLPILPVAVIGTEDRLVFNKIKHLQRPRITVWVGKTYTLPSLGRNDRETTLAKYTDEIMCHIAALLPPGYRGVYADHPRLLELLDGEQEDQTIEMV
jgi:1-acyl-sn-glycerol-3-phosphate acyltransferase